MKHVYYCPDHPEHMAMDTRAALGHMLWWHRGQATVRLVMLQAGGTVHEALS